MHAQSYNILNLSSFFKLVFRWPPWSPSTSSPKYASIDSIVQKQDTNGTLCKVFLSGIEVVIQRRMREPWSAISCPPVECDYYTESSNLWRSQT